ncbi:ABC transporter substrate-binding protein [Neorhizobium galegae]|uniref:Putative ABC transport system periplasmic binding protein n=1 Tax=Neorhizobium galegae bv. orientalis str. HAMBI 540 TaxID=1028800 RepID=A0A068STR3_NEOGA|nr:ABC transporter substrate-binding protein [Neorhizobium galegae]CDN49702.1 Putative ABC transport system periplasmic binding protein [Neorhizobium galegae bv. orientalis str. HAMBI 540]
MKPLLRIVGPVLLGSTLLFQPAHAETPPNMLVVGFSMTNILTLDPAAITGKETVQVLTNIYDNLVALDAVNRAQVDPQLAESWTIADDNGSITFKLRKGATFASGNPVTSADVVWSFKRLMKLNLAQASFLKTHGFSAANADASFTAPDDGTVVIKLPKKVDPQIIVQTLGIVGPGSILDMKAVMEHDKNGDMGAAWLTNNSAGSGPFTLGQWQSNERVTLEQNPKYWGEKPAMRRIMMRHLAESQSQRLMLEKGDIDIAFSMSAADLKALESSKDVKIQTNGGSGFYYLAVSMKDEKFQKPKVREALRYLIDYQGLNDSVLPYFGKLRDRPVPAGIFGALPNAGYKLDVAKAKALLAEAGYPNGFSTTLRAISDVPFMSLATAIQATLAQAGIKAEIVTGSGDQIYGAMRERKYELVVGRGGGGQLPHPDSNFRAIVYNPNNADEAKLTNFQGWRTSFYDEKINKMIDDALVEGNKDKQIKEYQDIQAYYAEMVPAIQPFSEVVDSVGFRADIKGLELNPSWSTQLRTVKKER